MTHDKPIQAGESKIKKEPPGKNTAGAFQKNPYLLATEIHPEKKTFSRGFHFYSYASKKEAEGQLALIKKLIGAKHPELEEKACIVKNQHDKETPYRFLLSPEQEELLYKIKTHPRLIKSIRWDSNCFIEDFIHGITPLKNRPRHRQKLRSGQHKKFTAFAEGVFAYEQRPSPYPKEKLHTKKEKRSQHQSTSLITRKAQIPVFGHGKDRMNKLAGVILDADDALVNRYFIYDGGTVSRPYEANTFAAAKAYHQKVTNPYNTTLFSDRKAFKKALQKQTGKHNEVLARIRWKTTSSSIGIFNDTFEARCVARYYAERVYKAVKTLYEASGKGWDKNYQIPIVYYLPGNDKSWTSYSEKSRQADKEKAESIYSNSKNRQQAVADGHGEFLLLLDNPQLVWQNLLDDTSHPLLTMLKQGQFQLIEALYQRTGLKASLSDALKTYAEKLCEQRENLTRFLFKNDKGKTPLFQAAESNKLGILKFILNLDIDKKLINETNNNNVTPLYFAAQKGHLEILLALLKKGADVNQAVFKGVTPLYFAAKNGHIDVVLALLKNGADVNQAKIYGVTPLYIAAKEGHIDVVLALLEKGADVNQVVFKGATPLYFAAKNGHIDVVLALLEKGADINKDLELLPTIIHYAARSGNTDIIQWIANNQSGLLFKKDNQGLTIAHHAAQSGNPNFLNIVLDLRGSPRSFTIPHDLEGKHIVYKTLLRALDDNFTLTDAGLPSHLSLEINSKLSRNKAFENATTKFSDVAQAFYQGKHPISAMSHNELFDKFRQTISNDIPDKHVRIAFDSVMYTSSPQGRLNDKKTTVLNIVKQFSQAMPTSNNRSLFYKTGFIETNDAKIKTLSDFKAIINVEYPSLDDFKESVISYYKQNETLINHQRNKVHTFFSPSHKTTTRKMFDDIFDALNITQADISAPVPHRSI